uniref:Uncharacterized protein n=1 Tax=Knipowitschia caucasica TaxID=637954 RepID=A0AAV2K0K0_KNICA
MRMLLKAGRPRGSWGKGARAGEALLRGRSRLINGPWVTAIKVACQWRGSEAQRRFSAMIEEGCSLLRSKRRNRTRQHTLAAYLRGLPPPRTSHFIPVSSFL